MTDLTIPAYICRPSAFRGRCVVVLDYSWGDTQEIDHGPIDDRNLEDSIPPQLIPELREILADNAEAIRNRREDLATVAQEYDSSRGSF